MDGAPAAAPQTSGEGVSVTRTASKIRLTVLPTVLLSLGLTTAMPQSAGATTDPGTLAGEGGTFLQPVVTKLIDDASSNLDGLFGGYVATGLDPGIADFVGTGPDAFNADFAVSERPLTSAEQATATTDGRAFAYVPFAATPVAIGAVVPDSDYSGGDTITAGQLCPHIDMTVADVGALFGIDGTDPVNTWNDSRFTCSNSLVLGSEGVTIAANDDPTMANYALMALLDSNSTSQGYFSAGLQSAFSANAATTTSTTPSEKWPYTGTYVIAGGDDPFIGKLLTINTTDNVPSNLASDWLLGGTFPISSVWTGAPLGAPWDIPTAAVQNAEGAYVAPSAAAAAAAEADATLAKTSDPTTNNLVTFNSTPSDAASYNSYLMEETYLVVPTNGLPANKDLALADLIRFALGPKGQTDIKSFGAAPATSAMDTAGLAVAAQLDADAAATAPSTAASSTTATTSAGSPSTSSTSGSTGSAADGGAGSGSGGSGSSGSSGSGLAFTGAPELVPSIGIGVGLLLAGALLRRKLRRRTAAR
jgi:ABC-type phosphate transport system substrate-binding protein